MGVEGNYGNCLYFSFNLVYKSEIALKNKIPYCKNKFYQKAILFKNFT